MSSNNIFSSGHSKTEYQEEDEKIDLKLLLGLMWRSKFLIVTSIIGAVLLAFLIALVQTPKFESTGKMVIKQSEKSSALASALGGGGLGGLMGGSFGLGSGVNISNEMEILQSRSMSEAMARKIKSDPIMSDGRMYPVLWEDWPEDSIMIPIEVAASRIRKNILFELIEKTTIVRITYESPSAIEAARMVNLAMDTYKEQSTEQSLDLSSSAANFLKAEQADLKDSLRMAEDKLQRYMAANEIVQLDAQTQELIRQNVELKSMLYEARSQLEAVNASINEYQQRLDSLKPGLSDKLSNAVGPNIERLQFKISELETEKALIYANYPDLETREVVPDRIKSINSQIANLKEKVRSEAKSVIASNDEFIGFLGEDSGSVLTTVRNYSTKLIELNIEKLRLKAKVDFLSGEENRQEAFLNNVPENTVQLARLKRQVEVLQELYLMVTKELAQTNFSAKAEMGNSRPLDKGEVPAKPSKPFLLLYLLGGVFIGGVISTGYVILAGLSDTTLYSMKELKKMGVNALGVIPSFSKSSKSKNKLSREQFSDSLVVANNPRSTHSDAFRRMANKISYGAKNASLKTLLLTSSRSGEGTTTVISNLGIALAESGSRVIIVDLNFENSELHKHFGCAMEPGIADMAINKVALDDTIQNAEIPGVDILSSGKNADPSKLITDFRNNASFNELYKTLTAKYDYVLFDTIPIGNKADSTGVFTKADEVILVSRFGIITQEEIEYSIDQLKALNANFTGVILNDYNEKEARD